MILCGLRIMKTFIVSLPCSLVASLLVADATLVILGLPGEVTLQLGIIAIATMLLYERGLAELGVIGAISLFAQANAQGPGSQVVAPYIMLALLLGLILMPPVLRVMDVSVDRPGAS
jgi:hypothetical protein